MARGQKLQCENDGCARIVREDSLQQRRDGRFVCTPCFKQPAKRATTDHAEYAVEEVVLWRRTIQNSGRTKTIEAVVRECRDKVLVLEITDDDGQRVLRRVPYETVMRKPA